MHLSQFTLLTDVLTMTERNLIRYRRIPQLIVFSSIQPVMFLLLFTYVFGGAIRTGAGGDYIQYLLPGILVQTAVFGAIGTGIGIAEDMAKGVIDRFKSAPMAQSAFLLGRTFADMLRNVFVVVLMLLVGYAIGFRLEGSVGDAMTAFALLLLFGFAFSWVSATISMLVKNVETAQVAGFIWVFPLVFASSVFVPVETMPDWLEMFAKYNPVTIAVNATRALALGNLPETDVALYVWESLGWIALILLVFIPIAVWLYRRA